MRSSSFLCLQDLITYFNLKQAKGLLKGKTHNVNTKKPFTFQNFLTKYNDNVVNSNSTTMKSFINPDTVSEGDLGQISPLTFDCGAIVYYIVLPLVAVF